MAITPHSDDLLTHRLVFTIGPVQGFVSEARRTRDLWAGSFLLSWLSATAMAVVLEGGGTIVLPKVTDGTRITSALLAGVVQSRRGTVLQSDGPDYDPDVPNRFEADVPDDFDPRTAEQAVRAAWGRLADAVWDELIAQAVPSDRKDVASAIWQRQIPPAKAGSSPQGGRPAKRADTDPLWEISWVMAPRGAFVRKAEQLVPDGTASTEGALIPWLDRRKGWRTPVVAEAEPGTLCSLTGRFQELSGVTDAAGKGREAQRTFWRTFRENLGGALDEGEGSVGLLDLREDERLSAPALVKRLFTRLDVEVLRGALGWVPKSHYDEVARQRPSHPERLLLVSYRPSTSAVAATFWVRRAALKAPKEAKAFLKVAEGALQRTLLVAERFTPGAIPDGLGQEDAWQKNFAAIDGKVFDRDYLELVIAREATELAEPGFKPGGARRLLGALDALSSAAIEAEGGADEKTTGARDAGKVGRPSDLFAVLLADGDGAGKLLSDLKRREPFLKALDGFTTAAKARIRQHAGARIYIGGDDVLALAPPESALTMAAALHDAYAAATLGLPTSLSVAVVFAKTNVPLSNVLRQAHDLLDNKAKSANGRDSLAIRISRDGGDGPTWVGTFAPGPGEGSVQPDFCRAFTELARRARQTNDSTRALTSNRFVYGLNASLPGVLVTYRRREEADQPLFDLDTKDGRQSASMLIRALGGEPVRTVADADFGALWSILLARKRDKSTLSAKAAATTPWSMDGLLIAKALAENWRRVDDPAFDGTTTRGAA